MDRVIKYGYVALFVFLLFLVFWPFLEEPVVTHGPQESNMVALTFDDGPGEQSNMILQVLKEKNVTATFFVVGLEIEKHPDIFEMMSRDGHELGVHSYDHGFEFLWSKAAIKESVRKTQELLPEKSPWYRPPYGIPSPIMKKAIEEENMVMVGWNANGFDYEDDTSDIIVKRVLSKVKPGSIILLHDVNPLNNHTIQALPQIIDGLRKKGYEFVNLSTLLRRT